MTIKSYIFFWGCTIQVRYPFMEKATRLVAYVLGISMNIERLMGERFLKLYPINLRPYGRLYAY